MYWDAFATYQAECLDIAEAFGYPQSVCKAIREASDEDTLSRIMTNARKIYL